MRRPIAAGLAVLLGFAVGFATARSLEAEQRARLAEQRAPIAAPIAPGVLLASPPTSTAALKVALYAEGEGPLGLGISPGGHLLSESVEVSPDSGWSGPLRIDYSMSAELTRKTLRVLRRGRVKRGHVIVMDPHTGRVLVYASTDPEALPPDQAYPAASLVKIITAAAALSQDPGVADEPCVYRGNPYRLTPRRITPPRSGNEMSLERSLASSNNQCFAQLAVNTVGHDRLLAWIARFGWFEAPAPGHAKGTDRLVQDDYDLGRLGCGLSGCRITPLHAVQLAASLVHGQRIEPWWVDRVVDGVGRELALPEAVAPRRIMSQRLADELREMLVRTTRRGTARGAFRDRRGRPKLGSVRVSGKTGNLSGRDDDGRWEGRYEWFAGVAPADDPQIAIAVVQLHDHLWWMKSSEIAADVLKEAFCQGRHCAPELVRRYTQTLGDAVAPVFLREGDAL